MRYDFNMHSYDIPDQALFGIMNDIYYVLLYTYMNLRNDYSIQRNNGQQEYLLPQFNNYITHYFEYGNFENTNNLPEIERFLQSTRSVFFFKFFGFLVWCGSLAAIQLKKMLGIIKNFAICLILNHFEFHTIGPITNLKSPLLPLSLNIVHLILPPTHQKALTLFSYA